MSYSEFSLEKAIRAFRLNYKEEDGLFENVAEVEIRAGLQDSLNETAPIALANNTEKARSELIVAPILLEVRRMKGGRIGFFSGITFDVEPDQGLSGVCDFLLSRSPNLLVIGAPVFAIVEAKNDNIRAGLGQCAAELVAARIFNERSGAALTPLFGVVTTGSLWRFLRLDDDVLSVDRREYFLDNLGKILGIFSHCVGEPV